MASLSLHRTFVASFALIATLTAQIASAALVAEFDFRTNQNASIIKPGSTGTATLANGATVNTGVAVGDGAKLNSYFGSLQVGASNQGLQTTESYTKYFGNGPAAVGATPGFGNFAASTFVAVFKPNFSTPIQTSRKQFFVNGSTSVTGVSFVSSDDGKITVAGGRAAENSFALVSPSQFSWDNNNWYMVAFSMNPSSAEDFSQPAPVDAVGLADGKIRIYIRTIKVGSTPTPNSSPLLALSTDTQRIWNDRQIQTPTVPPGGNNNFPPQLNNQLLAFGNRNDPSNVIDGEGALGQFALIQLYDNFSDTSDLNQIFATLVPEPSATAVVVMGCVGLLGSRRSRARIAK